MNQIIQITQNHNFDKYINKIQFFLTDLIDEYPLHDKWFKEIAKELKCNINKEREILFVKSENDEIIGVSILKKTEFEKKICTLRVAKNYQKKGIGTMLVKASCEFLATDKPIITVSQSRHHEFIRLFKQFNFTLDTIYCGKYCPGVKEYCYNGILLPESILKYDTIEDDEIFQTYQIA